MWMEGQTWLKRGREASGAQHHATKRRHRILIRTVLSKLIIPPLNWALRKRLIMTGFGRLTKLSRPPRLITQVAFLGQSSTLAQEPLSTSHPFDMYRDPYTPLMHMATLLLGLAASCADKGRNPHDFVTTLRD